MSLEQLTKTVEELKSQVAALQQFNKDAPGQAPIIHESWYCSGCSNYFYSQNSKLNHRCSDAVEQAKIDEMERFNEVLHGEMEPTIRKVNFVITPDGFSVPAEEAAAMAMSGLNERRKRASLAAHDRSIGVRQQ